eukprot:TRINITY_DN1143_c0_g3_i1.p1 TRINITY_DN1143_c0_g3~~TRINITY_DN1143_c0_g3_i1.p1  ORF type:complete len:170 (+),score=56.38 TRINITY_DN1143_c0_g3_i1:63-572(+)
MERVKFKVLRCTDEECIREDNTIRSKHKTSIHNVLEWEEKPRNAMVVKRPKSKPAKRAFESVYGFLIEEGITVWTQPADVEEMSHLDVRSVAEINPNNVIDFVVCLGGDGTVLYSAALFEENCPPFVCFAMGSLGFLSTFDLGNWKNELKRVIEGGFNLSIRLILGLLT